MGEGVKLTEAQREALSWLALPTFKDKWCDTPPGSPAMLGGMVRRGLLRSTRQSENVRGEGRVSWAMYKITEAGGS